MPQGTVVTVSEGLTQLLSAASGSSRFTLCTKVSRTLVSGPSFGFPSHKQWPEFLEEVCRQAPETLAPSDVGITISPPFRLFHESKKVNRRQKSTHQPACILRIGL